MLVTPWVACNQRAVTCLQEVTCLFMCINAYRERRLRSADGTIFAYAHHIVGVS